MQTPEQTNSYDCGPCACENIHKLAEQALDAAESDCVTNSMPERSRPDPAFREVMRGVFDRYIEESSTS
jgi:Ulp1 family protease